MPVLAVSPSDVLTPGCLGGLQPHLAAGWGKALLQEVVTRHQSVFQCLPQRKFLWTEIMLSSPKESRSAGEQGAGDGGDPACSF